MRVLVCGGRDYQDAARVFFVLDHYHAQRPFAVLIHGAATGADTLAADWGRQRCVMTLAFPALWDNLDAMPCVLKRRADGTPYNAMAGSIRNAQMIAEGEPDLVVAFPGMFGTMNMKKQARLAKVPVLEIPA